MARKKTGKNLNSIPIMKEAEAAPKRASPEETDFTTAGARSLRGLAQACRVKGGRDCRRLEAAADLLSPDPDEPGAAAAEVADGLLEVASSKRTKARKAQRAADVVPEGKDDVELDDIDFDADLDDEEA